MWCRRVVDALYLVENKRQRALGSTAECVFMLAQMSLDTIKITCIMEVIRNHCWHHISAILPKDNFWRLKYPLKTNNWDFSVLFYTVFVINCGPNKPKDVGLQVWFTLMQDIKAGKNSAKLIRNPSLVLPASFLKQALLQQPGWSLYRIKLSLRRILAMSTCVILVCCETCVKHMWADDHQGFWLVGLWIGFWPVLNFWLVENYVLNAYFT